MLLVEKKLPFCRVLLVDLQCTRVAAPSPLSLNPTQTIDPTSAQTGARRRPNLHNCYITLYNPVNPVCNQSFCNLETSFMHTGFYSVSQTTIGVLDGYLHDSNVFSVPMAIWCIQAQLTLQTRSCVLQIFKDTFRNMMLDRSGGMGMGVWAGAFSNYLSHSE